MMGKIKYCLQLLAILLGKFIWIGTSKKEIIKNFSDIKGNAQQQKDPGSIAIFALMYFLIVFLSVCYKVVSYKWR